ncbi:MAG: choice-of-anchor P family protein, partial [Acidimicrobiales bacterium]|nr:choice-of-anchor P family protein [Acidimicrobiales bacterium]
MCLSLAAICAVVAFTSPNVGAADEEVVDDVGEEIPPPEVFSGNASARAITVSVAQQYPLVPVEDLLTFIALEGQSAFSSSARSARASLFFPGQGGIVGPSLACGTFGAQFPAEFKPILDTCLRYQYPLSVVADDSQPDAASTGSLALGAPTDDISGEATTAKAHAAEDGVSSDAAMIALRVIGIPPFGPLNLPIPQLQLDGSVASADIVTARTDQRIVSGALVTRATTTISGLKLVGGIVRIGSIDSVSETRDDGQGGRTATADLDVSGVTVAGQPAKITNKGIVVNDPKNPTPLNKALFDQANNLVKQFGIKVTALKTEETLESDGPAVASVGGVLVEFTRNVTGLPLLPSPIAPGQQLELNGQYTVSVQLAQTGAKSTAANFGLDGEDEEEFIDDFTDVDGESFDD